MNDHQAELDYEREVNRAYWAALGRKKEYPVAGRPAPRNQPWGCLTARIRVEDAEDDGAEFYIGPRYLGDLQGVQVVSWAAPAAHIHFQNLKEWEGRQVLVRRVFHESGAQILDFSQDPRITDGPAFQSRARRPNLPPAATYAPVDADHVDEARDAQRRRREEEQAAAAARRKQEALDHLRKNRPAGLRPPGRPGGATESPTTPPASPPFSALDTEEYLIRTLEAPRTGQLESVLGTLRPDQHSAVVWPPDQNLLVEGHPGTGKSIVATHRAAWLVNPHREGPKLTGTVLVVGPTENWRAHVRESIKGLSDGSPVLVRSFDHLTAQLIGQQPFEGPQDGQLEAVAEETGRFIQRMVAHFRPTTGRKWLSSGFQMLRTWNASDAGLKPSADLQRWRHNLPDYSRALKDQRLWPALALLAVLLEPPERVAHVIVDEAQDLRPIEWMVLSHFDPDSWTLIGDLNQRRAESSHRTWTALTDLIGGAWPAPIVMARGYRSTQNIMNVAASLLPRGARRASSVLGKGAPVIALDARQQRASIVTVMLRAVNAHWKDHADGTVAVIHPHPRLIREDLKRNGWSPEAGGWWQWEPKGRPVMKDRDARFRLLSPIQARGIEFDAVIVVEPADFPKTTLIGNGPLYTALTRANKQLVIVHEKPVQPRALADALRSVSSG